MSVEFKKTPLHDWHVRHGARMVEFGGWDLPIQFTGIVAEHHAVRRRAGLFDVSHMGEIRARGADALAFIQHLVTNDASRLESGQALYTVMTNDRGGIIDDLLVYRLADDDYLLVVNAATTPKDVAWIERQAADWQGEVGIEDQSELWAQLAVQGPLSEQIVRRVLDVELDEIRYYRSTWTSYRGGDALVSRTGYTGEDGFEIYLPAELAEQTADAIFAAGSDDGLLAAGLGARDTLRLEAGMLLYGNDMDEDRTPIEAGLAWLVKPDKGEFVGRDALLEQLEHGPRERLVGFVLEQRGVPRHGYPIIEAGSDSRLGEVSSGGFSPTLESGIGLGYVPAACSEPESELAIDVRGRRMPAKVVKLPFYRRRS